MDYFSDPINQLTISRLESYGLQLNEVETEQNYHSAYIGKRFVVSGVFDQFSREELKKEIESFGGIILSSVSSKTDYLIAGKGMGPSKKIKANQHNVPILNEFEYLILKG